MAIRNTGIMGGLGETLQQWLIAEPKAYIEAILYRAQHLPQTNFELGCDFAERGQWKDAVFRFRVATYFQPHFPKAYYNLGCCYLRLGKRVEAKKSFIRALEQDPKHADALMMLSALDPACVPPAQRPRRLPAATVIGFFSSIAEEYDAIETANQYQGGKLCIDALRPFISDRKDLRIVDLGCGTGLASRPFRPIASHITGIDCTPAMVQIAQQFQVNGAFTFNAVLQEDILDLPRSAADVAAADIVLCCNVAQFVGDLHPLLSALAATLAPQALVVLTIEPFNVATGYGMNIETGRFGHHPQQVKDLAQQCGFSIKREGKVQLYPGVATQMMVLSKAGA